MHNAIGARLFFTWIPDTVVKFIGLLFLICSAFCQFYPELKKSEICLLYEKRCFFNKEGDSPFHDVVFVICEYYNEYNMFPPICVVMPRIPDTMMYGLLLLADIDRSIAQIPQCNSPISYVTLYVYLYNHMFNKL